MASALITNTTINDHIREEIGGIMRKRKLLTVLQGKGQVELSCSGEEMDWRIRYKRHIRTGYGSGEGVSFAKHNLWKKAVLGWRAHVVSSSIDKFDKLKNKGRPAIIKAWSGKIGQCIDDLKDSFSEDLYNNDGEASGTSSKLIHGIETVFANMSSAGAYIVTPAGSYAGLNMTLGTFGGAWTGTWPDGYATNNATHYDFWTPVYLDATNSSWSAASAMGTAGKEIIDYATTFTEKNGETLDMICMDRRYFLDFTRMLDSQERVITERGPTGSLLVKAGHKDIVYRNGVEIVWEYGLPTQTAYGFVTDQLKIRSMQDQLFKSETDFDIDNLTDKVEVDFFGNLMVKTPRHLLKISNVT